MVSLLVDKSLVTREVFKGRGCFRLHETMREYASFKQRDEHKEELLWERFLEYVWTTCLESADRARYRLVEWLTWAELEIDNLRAVLQQCLAHGDFSRARISSLRCVTTGSLTGPRRACGGSTSCSHLARGPLGRRCRPTTFVDG
jgi:predicted ATPase